MGRADIAIAVRRLATAGVVMSLKGKKRSWHRGRRLPNVLKQRLDVWQTGGCRCCRSLWRGFWARMSIQGLVFVLGFWCYIRKRSQVLIQTVGTKHSHFVRGPHAT